MWDMVTGDREPSRVMVEAGKDVYADDGVYNNSIRRKGSLCERDHSEACLTLVVA